MKKITDKALIRFLVSALIFYLGWYVLYVLWLHPWKKLDIAVINSLISISSSILSFLNYPLIDFPYDENIRTIGIDGSHGLWVGDPCNGITLFALFTGFIVAFPGNIKWKLIFIPIGIISIHLLNVIRIVGLALIAYYAPEYLVFNHTYTFTILVYAYVFFLWYLWSSAKKIRKIEGDIAQ